MIYGLTHEKDGSVKLELAVAGKIALGEGVTTNRKYPQKSDHFLFKKQVNEQWVEDAELTQKYGSNCKSIDIVFLNDDIETVFPTQMEKWSQSQLLAYSDGVTIWKRQGNIWKTAEATPERIKSWGLKPRGTLRFILAAHPVIGSIYKLETTSYNSVKYLYSSLFQVKQLTGGRLAGIPLTLKVKPKAVFPEIGKRVIAHVAFIEFTKFKNVQNVVIELAKYANTFDASKALTVIDEPEEKVAAEMAAEFFPDDETETIENVDRETGEITLPEPKKKATDKPYIPIIERVFEVAKGLGLSKSNLTNLYRGKHKTSIKNITDEQADKWIEELKKKLEPEVVDEKENETSIIEREDLL